MIDSVEERLQIAMEATGGANMDDRRVARRVRPPEEEAESIHHVTLLPFFEGFFESQRKRFGPKRKDGARRPRGSLKGLAGERWSLRDLKDG